MGTPRYTPSMTRPPTDYELPRAAVELPPAFRALADCRLSLGMSQGAAARAVGCDRTTYCRVEGGRVRPSLDLWRRIRLAVAVPPDVAEAVESAWAEGPVPV